MERLTALGAELGALSASTAAGTEGGGFRSQVKIFGQILAAHFFLNLLHGGLRLGGGDFRFDIRRAIIAKPALLVPAHGEAGPLGAFGTLAEVGLYFFHGLLKSFIVPGALDGAFDFISAGTGAAKDAPK